MFGNYFLKMYPAGSRQHYIVHIQILSPDYSGKVWHFNYPGRYVYYVWYSSYLLLLPMTHSHIGTVIISQQAQLGDNTFYRRCYFPVPSQRQLFLKKGVYIHSDKKNVESPRRVPIHRVAKASTCWMTKDYKICIDLVDSITKVPCI